MENHEVAKGHLPLGMSLLYCITYTEVNNDPITRIDINLPWNTGTLMKILIMSWSKCAGKLSSKSLRYKKIISCFSQRVIKNHGTSAGIGWGISRRS